MQMTPAQARLIDPLVTELALGYRSPTFIAEALFPRRPVGTRAGKVPKFSRKNWRLIDTRHAPGADIPEIQIEYGLDQYSLVDRALNGKVPVETEEEAAAVPGINMRAESLELVQDIIALDIENKASTIARTAGNYTAGNTTTLAGATRWSQTTGTPGLDVDNAKDVIRGNTGAEANTMVISRSTFRVLKNRQDIKDQFKYTTSSSITLEMLRAYFQIDRLILAGGSYLKDDDTVGALWGDDTIIAYVPYQGTSYRQPSYGYTLFLRGYPYASQSWYNPGNNSWLVPWHDAAEPWITSMAAGYLIKDSGIA